MLATRPPAAGAGKQPHDPTVRGSDDLVSQLARQFDFRIDLVAQSMGGVIAALIERHLR